MNSKISALPETFRYDLDEYTSDQLRADHGRTVPVFVRMYDKELTLLRFAYGVTRSDLEIARYALSTAEVSGVIQRQDMQQISEIMPVIHHRLVRKLGADECRGMLNVGLPVDFVLEAIKDEYALHNTPENWDKYENSLMLAGDNIHYAKADISHAFRHESILKPVFDFLDNHPIIAPIALAVIFAAMVVNHAMGINS